MATYADDLRFAQATEKAVEVETFNGNRYLSGVAEVDEEGGSFSLFNPQHFGDSGTRRRMSLNDVLSVTVTDVDYKQ